MNKDPYKQREARKYEHPIASREHILECLTRLGEPVAFKRLAKTLNIESTQDRDALRKRLGAMVRAGQLIVDRRNVYAIARKMELITGKVSAHPDGYGFVLVEDDEDIFLTRRQMRQVFHGDVVTARIRSQNKRGKTEGEIVEVVERHTEQLVGRYYVANDITLLEPLNNRINHEVIIRDNGKLTCEIGQIVVARVVQQPSLHGVVMAEVEEILGDHLTPGIEVEIALRNNDIPVEWDDEVIAQVDKMPSKVRPADKVGRFDLTELPFVTIDGEDARDFDDAVYCEPKERGGWRLYVAIADVAHYVKPGTDLDNAARERATSVYFPQYVVPMLPEKLSNGMCSLNPEVERLVMVCEMTISSQGRVSGYVFYEGVILSHARLTYTEVAEIISEDADGPHRTARADIVEHIDELHNLYKMLVRQRKKRGAIEFESTEVHFQFSEAGRVQGIAPRPRNTAHKIIEECMLCANVSAARLISQQKQPGLYRVHEPPEFEKVEFLQAFLARFGVNLQFGDTIKPEDYQQVIEQLKDKQNGQVLQMSLLRSMNQAVYQMENKGHFGLGYAEYTHFTSPIRRYPDLLTHRLIKSEIYSPRASNKTLRIGRAKKIDDYPYDVEKMLALGAHTSFAERRADSAVYEVLEFLKCDYISDRVGEILPGVVTGVTKFGLFVELTDIFVEGLVHVSTLVGDYYHYDQGSQCLTGERSKVVYGMGDMVEVQIARVNVDERKVDFEIVSHTSLVKGGGKAAGSSKKKKSNDKRRSKSPAAKNRSRGPRQRHKKR